MGGKQSKETPEMSPDLEEVLEQNKHKAGTSKHPYYVVQLSEKEELEFHGKLVSDALAALVAKSDFTHIIVQTHGWNTPPDKAIAVPFTEFIAGMQNDRAMPKGLDFRPLFVAFIWPALPIEFARTDDALTRAELLGKQERELVGEDSDIAKAADAAKAAMEAENEDDEDLKDRMRTLVKDSKEEDDDDDDDDAVVNNAKEKAGAKYDDDGNEVVEDFNLLTPFKRIFKPVEHLVFGRLMTRGQRTGVVMGSVIGKLMKAGKEKAKVCMMANSLGAHVLCGVLSRPDQLPYRIHTVFFVQGAITKDLFNENGKFSKICNVVAGPVMCSYSARDLMLKNVYGPFHGGAIGFVGTSVGEHVRMKSLQELASSPYGLALGAWNNIDGSEYVYLHSLTCLTVLFYLTQTVSTNSQCFYDILATCCQVH